MLSLQVLFLLTIAVTTLVGVAGAGVISISHHISIRTMIGIWLFIDVAHVVVLSRAGKGGTQTDILRRTRLIGIRTRDQSLFEI